MSRTRKHKLTGGKAVDHSCRNHGECPFCTRNRTYNELRDKEKADFEEKIWKTKEIDYLCSCDVISFHVVLVS